jgi:phage recombination protein Bet
MTETKQLAIVERAALVPMEFNESQVELIKKTVAKGTTNDELALFLYTCKRTGLDPLIRQIYAVKRGGASNQMSIQTGIDGYRLIAERTGKYAPGREPSFNEANGKIVSATAYVKKHVGGEWHEVAATAYFDEYAQKFNGKLGAMWERMGHVMISKCAEALALRRAFPAEMAGVYTTEEMAQADVVDSHATSTEEHRPTPQRKSVNAAPVIKEYTGQVDRKFAPKGKSKYFSYTLTGNDGVYFQTSDEAVMETLARHKGEGNTVTLKVEETVNGQYTNRLITEIIVNAPATEKAEDYIPAPVEEEPAY